MIKNTWALILLALISLTGAFLIMLPMEAFSSAIRTSFIEYPGLDKACHFILFATLTALLYFGLNENKVNIFEYMIGFAMLAEGLQIFAERSVSVADGFANMGGVAVIWIAVKLYKGYEENKPACIAS